MPSFLDRLDRPLSCPRQIPRYIITLHELLAHTPPDHVEKNSLEHARRQLEDLSRQMHDEVRRREEQGMMGWDTHAYTERGGLSFARF